MATTLDVKLKKVNKIYREGVMAICDRIDFELSVLLTGDIPRATDVAKFSGCSLSRKLETPPPSV